MRLDLISLCLFVTAILFGCGGGSEDASTLPKPVNYSAPSPFFLNAAQNKQPKAADQAARPSSIPIASEPQNGWWWNPAEGGRGFAIERQGNQLFLAAFLYETSGAATWYVSTLTRQADGSYAGNMLRYTGGQTLLGSYRAPAGTTTPASASLTFSTPSAGTLIVKPTDGGADRRITLERFPISTPAFAASSGGFESGWWWNEAEGGRGYFIEVQGSTAFIASFMYDTDGQPVWYASTATLQNAQSMSGPLLQYANGQSLLGNYKPATPLATSPGSMSFKFTNPNTATIVLPNGAEIPVKRFIFNPAQPVATAGVGNCYRVNSNVVRFHLGRVFADGNAFPSHRMEIIPLSGPGALGKYRTIMYLGEAGDAHRTEEEELFFGGDKPLTVKQAVDKDNYVLVTTNDGFMPFSLALNEAKEYTLQQHFQTVGAGKLLLEGVVPEVWSATLLEIGPLQTHGKYFPLTCKIKFKAISANNKPMSGEGYSILWFAPGYGWVRGDSYSPILGYDSLEVVSVETEPQ